MAASFLPVNFEPGPTTRYQPLPSGYETPSIACPSPMPISVRIHLHFRRTGVIDVVTR